MSTNVGYLLNQVTRIVYNVLLETNYLDSWSLGILTEKSILLSLNTKIYYESSKNAYSSFFTWRIV